MRKNVFFDNVSRFVAISIAVSFVISAFSVVMYGVVSNEVDAVDIIDAPGVQTDVQTVVQPVVNEPSDVTIIERGQFWNRYSNGNIDSSRFPMNYWNSIESEYLPIDINIYRNFFGDYYWKNAKNTFDVYFSQYSVEDRASMVFYKNYEGMYMPSEISFGFNEMYWLNETDVELIDSLFNSEGIVDGNIITYQPFNNTDEIFTLTNNSMESALRISYLSDSSLVNTDSLVVSGVFTKASDIYIYVDGVIWDSTEDISGDMIEFGYSSKDIQYCLGSLIIFDSNMKVSSAKYEVSNIGDGQYEYRVVVPYEFLSNATFPIVIDPTWYASNSVLLSFNYNDNVKGVSDYIVAGGTDDRYDRNYLFADANVSALDELRITEKFYSYFSYDNYTEQGLPASTSQTFANLLLETGSTARRWFVTDDAFIPCPVSAGGGTPAGAGLYNHLDGNCVLSHTPTIQQSWMTARASMLADAHYARLNVSFDFEYSGWAYQYGAGREDLFSSGEYIISSDNYVELIRIQQVAWYDRYGDNFGFPDPYGEIRIAFKYPNNSTYSNTYTYEMPTFGGYISTYAWLWFYSNVIHFDMSFDESSNIGLINIHFHDVDDNPIYLNTTMTLTSPTSSDRVYVNFGSVQETAYYLDNCFAIDNVEHFTYNLFESVATAYSDILDSSLDYVYMPSETGFIYRYDSFVFDTTQPTGTDVKVRFYYNNSGIWSLIPIGYLPSNNVGYDGNGAPVTISMNFMHLFPEMRVKFYLTTSNVLLTPSVDSWAFNVVKARYMATTSTMLVESVRVEPLIMNYELGPGIVINLGDTTWSSNPTMWLFWANSVDCPDVNSGAWGLISGEVYKTVGGDNNWSAVPSGADIVVNLTESPSGIHSYLWYPNRTTDADNVWFKAMIYSVGLTKVLWVVSDVSVCIYANSAPIADAGGDGTVQGQREIYYDAGVGSADGSGYYNGVVCLDTCEWSFKSPGGVTQVYNRTVNSVSDGVCIYIFTNRGIYLVKLVLVDVYGLVSISYANVTVENSLPIADFDIVDETRPYVIGTFMTYIFDGSGSVDLDGDIVSYSWNWDDGTWTNKTTSEGGSQVTKLFTMGGYYNITLRVMDDESAVGQTTEMVMVISGLPKAVISDSVGNQISRLTIDIPLSTRMTFSGAASTAGSGTIVNYNWNWGDGTEIDSATPLSSKVYNTLGNYVVVLTVENSVGNYDDEYVYVSVVRETEVNETYEEGEFTSFGTAPRFTYKFDESESVNFTVSGSMLKDGFGGEFFEKYLFKERLSISIVRESGAFDVNNETNSTSNYSTESIIMYATYFGEDVNSGLIKYEAGAWADIYIYIKIDDVWYLANKEDISSVSISARIGEIQIEFDEIWDEVRIVTNPGLYQAIKNSFKSSNFTPAFIGFNGVSFLQLVTRS